MWLLMSPFLVIRLCSVSRVLRFQCYKITSLIIMFTVLCVLRWIKSRQKSIGQIVIWMRWLQFFFATIFSHLWCFKYSHLSLHCIAKELTSSYTVSVFHFCSLLAHGVVKFSLRSSLGKVYCRWNFLQCKATLGKHHFDDNLRIWNIYTVYAFFGDKNSDLFDVKKAASTI